MFGYFNAVYVEMLALVSEHAADEHLREAADSQLAALRSGRTPARHHERVHYNARFKHCWSFAGADEDGVAASLLRETDKVRFRAIMRTLDALCDVIAWNAAPCITDRVIDAFIARDATAAQTIVLDADLCFAVTTAIESVDAATSEAIRVARDSFDLKSLGGL